MRTRLIKPSTVEDPIIVEAGDLIRHGEIVAFPTETVYGIGANAFDPVACSRIFDIKGRPSNKPLSLHVATVEMINRAAYVSLTAQRLIETFLPGPLTLILPKRSIVPDEVTCGLSTVGIRMPSNRIAQAFLGSLDVPVAATSANLSGQPAAVNAQQVFDALNGLIPLILDGGECRLGLASTVFDVENRKILREGSITAGMLETIV